MFNRKLKADIERLFNLLDRVNDKMADVIRIAAEVAGPIRRDVPDSAAASQLYTLQGHGFTHLTQDADGRMDAWSGIPCVKHPTQHTWGLPPARHAWLGGGAQDYPQGNLRELVRWSDQEPTSIAELIARYEGDYA